MTTPLKGFLFAYSLAPDTTSKFPPTSGSPVHKTPFICDTQFANNASPLSHHFRDFENLHGLILEAGGRHPGIIVVCKDNDPRRDMTTRGIVNAIAKLLAAGVPLENEFSVLNRWR